LALAVAGAACGSSVGQSTLTTEAPSLQDPHERRASVEVATSLSSTLAAEGASNLILDFIRDGVLDFGEYEQGVLTHIKCMEDYGWTSSPGYPRLAPWGQYQVQFEGYTAAAREARGASVSDLHMWEAECSARYWTGLSRIWDAKHSPSEAEEQEARNVVATCLRDAEVEIQERPSARQLFELFMDQVSAGASVAPWIDCVGSAKERYFTSGSGIELAR
jgi:hypothetical protein